MKRKFKLEGVLTLRKDFTERQKKEIAARFDLPQNAENQRDLMFMSAILVSTGTNRNGAHFLGSELIKARHTISQKPLNIEHEEHSIAGHITEWLYMDQSGNVLDDAALYKSIVPENGKKALDVDQEKLQKNTSKIDEIPMDIGIICAVYRDRFPELAEDIEMGRYKVSMECYYENFDIKIGDFILPRSVARTASMDTLVDSKIDAALLPIIRDVANGKSLGDIQVARVLRDIHFCGVGLVENPANIRSLVLEAAKELEKRSKDLDVGDGCCAVASMTLGDPLVLNQSVELSVFELATSSSYTVICEIEGKPTRLLPCKDLDEAREVAAQTVFKLHNTGESFTVRTAEICSDFIVTPEEEIGHIATTYRVVDGIVEESSETMESAKICVVVDNRTVSPDSQTEVVEDLDKVEEVQEIETVEEVTEVEEEAPVIPQTPSKKVERFDIPSRPEKMSREERGKLSNDSFALRTSRQFPIHTADRVKANMEMFSYTKRKLAVLEIEEFFKNIIISALKHGVSTSEFEASVKDLKFTEGKDYNTDYGVPRLKKFPLDTREQIISAMSRFPRLKMDLSAMEKEGLFINILRAASKFGINTEAFRRRVLEPSEN